jgi:hypothetical protein
VTRRIIRSSSADEETAVYGRIERFEGTDANRLDASDDELHRTVVGRRRRGEPAKDLPHPTAPLPEGVARVVAVDQRESEREPETER